MPPILVGIDGTGSDTWGSNNANRNRNYDDDFRHSFVRRICAPGLENTLYIRGPGYAPAYNSLITAIHTGRDFIRGRRSAGVKEPILLTGYSRGAAGAVVIANMLGQPQYRIPVDAMLLFDCVDRDGVIDSARISNVGHVLHVMRSEGARSRRSFGNSGTEVFPGSPTKYTPKWFKCTHGGMGGTPWPLGPGKIPEDYIYEGPGAYGVDDGRTNVRYEEDSIGAQEVQSYIKQFMGDQGFPIPPDVSYPELMGMDERGRQRREQPQSLYPMHEQDILQMR